MSKKAYEAYQRANRHYDSHRNGGAVLQKAYKACGERAE